MDYELNDPIWVLNTAPGFFEAYLDKRHPETGIRIGVVANGAGFGALVPSHWVTRREIDA